MYSCVQLCLAAWFLVVQTSIAYNQIWILSSNLYVMSCLCRVHYKTDNNLVLTLDKTIIMKFITKNSLHSTVHIGHKEKCMLETVNTEFLGLQIDTHINWKNHIEEMIPKLTH